MIDRASRNRLATALRRYVSGRITNDDLDCIAVDWRDRGAVAVSQRAWALYDDNYQHRATGKHYLGKSARDEVSRWIIYLHSDVEYTWPEFSFIQIVNPFMNILTFGWSEARKERRFQEFQAAGDYSVWPFATEADHRIALDRPKFFAGQ